MDREELLASFDRQVRRSEPARSDAGCIEREDRVVREVRGEWSGVIWSDLDERTADAAIAAQIVRFADRPGRWEWKHYSYDRPADLPRRLRAAGLVAEPQESVLVAPIDELALDHAAPAGIELVPVEGEAAVRTLVALQDEVFGGDGHPGMADELIAALGERPPAAAAVMALAAGEPVAGGRVEFAPDSDFAGLWGGCTRAAWRGRGIFRALVAHRAALAAARGYRWLHVDASEESRPILLRLGFTEIAKTTPYVPGAGVAGRGPDAGVAGRG